MTHRMVTLGLISVLLLPLSVHGEESPTTAPATQPSTKPSADSLKAMTDLATHTKLLLSNDAKSAHDKFSCAIVINPAPNGPAQSTTILLVRDGDHVGIVVGARGLPAYYMTDGLLVGVDPKNPGQLMMHEGGSVRLHFAGKDEGGNLSYSSHAKENHVVVDPSALIQSMAAKLSETDYRPELGRLGLIAEGGDRLRIRLPRADKPDSYPIESLLFEASGPSGLTFAFGNVTPNVALKKSIARCTADDVRKLGIPIRKLSDDEIDKEYFALARAEFAENEEEQETAEKLRDLFKDDVAMEAK